MRKKIIIYTLCIIIFLTIILAINVNEEQNSKFNIVTSFYPVYIATLNITDGVENVSVKNLTYNVTGCIHDFVLTTTELVTLAKADALVINGATMEGFMDKVISNFKDLNIIDSSNGIELKHESCDGEHEEPLGHSHEINPHIFVSVKSYIKQVQNICDELCKLDVKNKEIYEQNTREYISNLEELDKEIAMELSELNNKNIVASHNSLDYFAKDYGLNITGVIESEHGKAISAGELAHIIENIKENNVQAIFVEQEYNLKMVETISKETGVSVYMLNPVTSGKNNKEEYINIMKDNLKVIKGALS